MNILPDPAPPDEPTPALVLTPSPPDKSPVIDRAKNALRTFEATDRNSAGRRAS